MAELVDAPASGAGDRKVVEVRVLFWAPFFRLDLLVLDEFGYLPIARSGGQLLFHLVSKLYERASVASTVN